MERKQKKQQKKKIDKWGAKIKCVENGDHLGFLSIDCGTAIFTPRGKGAENPVHLNGWDPDTGIFADTTIAVPDGKVTFTVINGSVSIDAKGNYTGHGQLKSSGLRPLADANWSEDGSGADE